MIKHPWKKWIGQGLLAACILGINQPTWADSYTVQPGDTTYTVQSGDVLWKIAMDFGTTTEAIKTLNGLANGAYLQVGQVLKIPTAKPVPQPLPTPSEDIQSNTYIVQSGDVLWKIAMNFGTTTQAIKTLNGLASGDYLAVGQVLKIPMVKPAEQPPTMPSEPVQTQPQPQPLPTPTVDTPSTTYTVQSGDVLWKIAMNFGTTTQAIKTLNGLASGDYLAVGQVLQIPMVKPAEQPPTMPSEPVQTQPQPTTSEGPWVENQFYTVQQGDTAWTIAMKFGIPFSEFLKVNQLNSSSYLSIGQQVIVPVHHVPVKPTATATAGELLDWWTEAQYVFPIGKTAKVTDIQTGLSWNLKRTLGEFHADCEPLTSQDAEIMKKIWGGTYSWAIRPVIVEVDGRRLAASVSSMPHDVETIKENSFDGHHDMHFLNSLRHKDSLIDPKHQDAIKVAAGNFPLR